MTLNGETGPDIASCALDSHSPPWPYTLHLVKKKNKKKTTSFQPQSSSLFSSETFKAALKHSGSFSSLCYSLYFYCLFFTVLQRSTLVSGRKLRQEYAFFGICAYHSAYNTL